jgi:hypothetical protein
VAETSLRFLKSSSVSLASPDLHRTNTVVTTGEGGTETLALGTPAGALRRTLDKNPDRKHP